MAEKSGAPGRTAIPGAGDLPRRFRLEIVTPERQLVTEEVDALTAPGLDGEFGVLPQHTRLMTALGIGEVAYRSGTVWQHLAVAAGFVEVLPDRVIILAQTAELAQEIDVARARAAAERAEKKLAHPDADTEVSQAGAALRRALVRLRTAKRGLAGGVA
ncbi:MAG: F0F1 ATP synthase subunit epsilon [Acidobacteriota bacterium]